MPATTAPDTATVQAEQPATPTGLTAKACRWLLALPGAATLALAIVIWVRASHVLAAGPHSYAEALHYSNAYLIGHMFLGAIALVAKAAALALAALGVLLLLVPAIRTRNAPRWWYRDLVTTDSTEPHHHHTGLQPKPEKRHPAGV